MTHKFINNIAEDNSEASIYLYGSIGDTDGCKIDGNWFARELRYLDTQVELVKCHINSEGGGVFNGMAVVAALRDMTTPVHMYIDGLAASISAVIAVSGDKIFMQDYSLLMIHDPQYAATANLTAKQSKILDKVKNTLVKILSSRGKAEEDISKLMTEETWFTADEAKAHNLCDEIITSGKPQLKNLTPTEIVNKINNSYQSKTTMKITAQAAQVLNLATDANEADISTAIVNLHKTATDAISAKNVAEKKLSDYEAAKTAAQKAEAKTILDAAVLDGKIDAKTRPVYEDFFEKNFDGAKVAVESMQNRTIVSNQIDNKSASDPLLSISWDEAFRTGKLEDIKNKYPDHYEKMVAEKFK